MPGIQLNWQPPTNNADGTAISGEIIYSVYENDELIIDSLAPAQFSIDMTGRPSGNYAYQVSARYANSAEGARSAPVSVNFIVPPAAPINLTVELI